MLRQGHPQEGIDMTETLHRRPDSEDRAVRGDGMTPEPVDRPRVTDGPPHLPEPDGPDPLDNPGTAALDDEVTERVRSSEEELDRPLDRDVPVPPLQGFRPGG